MPYFRGDWKDWGKRCVAGACTVVIAGDLALGVNQLVSRELHTHPESYSATQPTTIVVEATSTFAAVFAADEAAAKGGFLLTGDTLTLTVKTT